MRKRRDPRTAPQSPSDGAPPDQAAVERALRAILDRLKPRNAVPIPTTGTAEKGSGKPRTGTPPGPADGTTQASALSPEPAPKRRL